MRKGGEVIKAYCPICGRDYKISVARKHKCPQSTLDAIDRSRKSEHDYRENKKPFGRRLTDGFEMLRQHDDSYLTEDHWEDE